MVMLIKQDNHDKHGNQKQQYSDEILQETEEWMKRKKKRMKVKQWTVDYTVKDVNEDITSLSIDCLKKRNCISSCVTRGGYSNDAGPSVRVSRWRCDQTSEEFRMAGIGTCFQGETKCMINHQHQATTSAIV